MPTPDPGTLDKLLTKADAVARGTLADPAADQAGPRLRSWCEVVRVAADLWDALPSAPEATVSDPDVMARLAGVAAGISRSVAAAGWPGPAPLDGRFSTIASLLQAAASASRAENVIEPAPGGERGKDDTARDRLVRVLYVSTHSTAVAMRRQIVQAEWDIRHLPGRAARADQAAIAAARAAMDRLDVFEQVAGAHLAARAHQRLEHPEPRPSPNIRALQTALERWDVQVHRSLLGRPDLPDLVRVGRVQALVAATTGVIAGGAAALGAAEPEPARRLALKASGAEAAWTRLAQGAGQLVGADGTTDPALIRAAAGLRAVIKTTACGPTSWATPDQLARQLDLGSASRLMQQTMTSSVDVAHLVRDLAQTAQLTAPARLIAAHTTRYLLSRGPEQTTARANLATVGRRWLATNERLPLTPPLQHQLMAAASKAVTSTRSAATLPDISSAPPHPSTAARRQLPRRAAPAPAPSRRPEAPQP